MANLPDGSGDAYSNLVQGDGSASLTFVMPGTVPLAVGSVVATVDNTAGAATTATLVIRDSSGEVIATKRQGATIDAGASGTATWALRLDDDTTASAAAASQIGFYDLASTAVASGTTTPLAFAFSFGTALLDLTTPTRPIFLAHGAYVIRATAETNTTLVDRPGKVALVRIAVQHNYGTPLTVAGNTNPLDITLQGSTMSAAMPWLVGSPTDFEVAIDHDAGVNLAFDGAVSVMKVG